MTAEERLKAIQDRIVWKMRLSGNDSCILYNNKLTLCSLFRFPGAVRKTVMETVIETVIGHTAVRIISLDNLMFLWSGSVYGPATLYQTRNMDFYFKGE